MSRQRPEATPRTGLVGYSWAFKSSTCRCRQSRVDLSAKRLGRVSRGEETVITRHDKPVARIVQEGPRNREQVEQAVLALEQFRQQIRARSKGRAKLSDAAVRSAIEERRRRVQVVP